MKENFALLTSASLSVDLKVRETCVNQIFNDKQNSLMNTRNIICAAMALLMSVPAMASNWRVRAVKEKEMKTITIELRDAACATHP